MIQLVATRRRASIDEIRKNPQKIQLSNALVDARILVTDTEGAINPTLEMAHEAIFIGWRRLHDWINSHAAELRTCHSLVRAAQDWKEAGEPHFSHLPDYATLKKYRMIRHTCSFGKDIEAVGHFLSAARTRQRSFVGLMALIVIVLSLLGTDIWLRNQEMTWSALGIWTLTRIGQYDGPAMEKIPGTNTPFLMGSSECEPDGNRYECPQHPATVQPFWIGKYEITFNEYSAFVLDKILGFVQKKDLVFLGNTDEIRVPPHEGWGRGKRPVINVRWVEAKEYAKWLEKLTHKPFRLPTEVEWEYACRADTTTGFSFGDDSGQLGEYSWFSKNSNNKTHQVGTKKPNIWNLHDMHGNVWEFVEDDFHENYDNAPADGQAWIDNPRGPLQVIRGGCWSVKASYCRSDTRGKIVSEVPRGPHFGFRLS